MVAEELPTRAGPSGSPAVLSATKGPLRRWLCLCIALATTPADPIHSLMSRDVLCESLPLARNTLHLRRLAEHLGHLRRRRVAALT